MKPSKGQFLIEESVSTNLGTFVDSRLIDSKLASRRTTNTGFNTNHNSLENSLEDLTHELREDPQLG